MAGMATMPRRGSTRSGRPSWDLLCRCFFPLATGCTLFGLLTMHSARRLGDISYGIYLLQGLVLVSLFRRPSVRPFTLASAVILVDWRLSRTAVSNDPASRSMGGWPG